ncbi:MAG: ribonuclease Y [Campylobacterales bacterium]
MINEILSGGVIATVSGVVGFFISKKITSAHLDIFTEQAKAKAKAIEKEAETLLVNASEKARKTEERAEHRYEDAVRRAEHDLLERESTMTRREKDLERFVRQERESVEHELKVAGSKRLAVERQEKALAQLKNDYERRIDESIRALERCAGMTKEEAKLMLLSKVEERSRDEIAHIVRRYENEAREQAERKANFLLAQATSRFAGTFASERLISIVRLEDDELKGRIIGKEGRNIKALEMVLGVDIIIDETPKEIVVSSFNLYRRAIATRTLELLIEDGRIQPARIEEIHDKVAAEYEEKVLHEGEEVVFETGVGPMHPELMKLLGRLRYRASYGQNALAHTLEVANMAGIIAAELGGDPKMAKRAGLLHDIGKALTHEHEGSHVDLGAEVCRRYDEDPIVINAIYAHHGHQEMNSIECAAVCAADALSAARPGARREVLESFLKRVTEIEEIAARHPGVKQAYAINAGREVRVIVNAEMVSDDETVLLAKEIAEGIEQSVNYPGEIKVSVIREMRSVQFAR